MHCNIYYTAVVIHSIHIYIYRVHANCSTSVNILVIVTLIYIYSVFGVLKKIVRTLSGYFSNNYYITCVIARKFGIIS